MRKGRPKSCARQLSYKAAPRRNQIVITTVCVVFFVGLLLLLGDWFFVKVKRPFRQVEISSSGHAVKVAQLQKLIERYTDQGFFALNVRRLQGQIGLLPWVESASIRRIWPDRMRILIHERHAVAIWNETQLLTSAAERFQPELSTFPAHLPRLLGPAQKEKQVLTAYLRFNQHVQTLGLKLTMVRLFKHTWYLQLKDGPSVLFSEDASNKALHRFDVLYRRLLRGKLASVQQVDLRYAGAAAVRWRQIRKA